MMILNYFFQFFIINFLVLAVTLWASVQVFQGLEHFPITDQNGNGWNFYCGLFVLTSIAIVIVDQVLKSYRIKRERTKIEKGVIIGETLLMDNKKITFRQKPILNKYLIFPEIDGKRLESLTVFTSTSGRRRGKSGVESYH